MEGPSDNERINKALRYIERKRKAIQELRNLISSSKDKNKDNIPVEVKQKVDEIFGCLSAVELLVGGKMGRKIHQETERLVEQWMWLQKAVLVFHLGLDRLQLTEMWLTNLSTLRIGFDKKGRNWTVNWKVNPFTNQYEGSFSTGPS
ncbi:hypothetical protein Ngar_c27860 [Candidatus Nitrososphaera gargensis Ga9.2]|uniref:Uncharacterized protein n=1 Tax=Nitrososphaera gargensis (strain Ga9.2) TaxID=1237085 RepID=K0ILV6_NITGG|nr:hypothetical protein [Candidatus Nitrososphaera gargensis]AFU59707.1 hypothetical protein Ngar_c27860 [Candidatus Nitrososphaera gargensis Ga9.2]